jgi:glycerol-3-phosphate O-acyltransferase
MMTVMTTQVKELEEKGVPVVLIPTHKSHIDYIVMSIICFHYNLPLPYIAAGDNLNIPIVGYLFRYSPLVFSPHINASMFYAAVLIPL